MEIPGYTLDKELGKGGMATVYLATQISLNRQVALKVMNPALAADGDFSDRFLSEARTIAQMNHPGIVAVYDVGVHQHHHYIAMELVAGGDLKQRIEQGPLPPEQVMAITSEVAEALAYAHGKGYVHRDIKPENILFRADGSAVISDFGIARSVHSTTRLTGIGLSVGTPHYMSPEQAMGKEVDGRADLYSLGIVVYEMLTGNLPFDADSTLAIAMAHVSNPPPSLPGALAQYQGILDGMLVKAPEQRLADCQALITQLQNPAEAPAPLQGAPADAGGWQWFRERFGSDRLMAISAGMAAAISLLVFAWLMVSPSSEPNIEFSASHEGAQFDASLNGQANHVGSQPKSPGGNGNFSPGSSGTDLESLLLGNRTAAESEPAAGAVHSNAGVEPESVSPEQTQQALIGNLLLQASEDLTALRLTQPQGQNAYEKYQTVLQLEPDNSEAQQGIRDIAQRYVEMSSRLLETIATADTPRSELDKIDTLLARAESISTDIDDVGRLRQEVTDYREDLQAIDQFTASLDNLLAEQRFTRAEKLLASMDNKPFYSETVHNGARQAIINARAQWQEQFAGRFVTIPGARYKVQDASLINLKLPENEVRFRQFQLAVNEVTRGQFAHFVQETRYQTDAEKEGGCYNQYDPERRRWQKQKGATWQNPGIRQTDQHPVVCISYNDAQAYADWLSQQTGTDYRLPTAPEWQYSALAGKSLAGFWKTFKSRRTESHCKNCNTPHATDATVAIGQFAPSANGLNDMFGNAGEWVDQCTTKDIIDSVLGGTFNILQNITRDVLDATTGIEVRKRDITCAYKGVMGLGWHDTLSEKNIARLNAEFPETSHVQRGFRLARDIRQ